MPLHESEYRFVIPQSVWSEFLTQFTQDHRGRLVTLKILDEQLGDFEVLSHNSLLEIAYNLPDHVNNLVVTVSRTLSTATATYAHVIVYLQRLEVVTDADGNIESCTVTDDDRAQTIICLEMSRTSMVQQGIQVIVPKEYITPRINALQTLFVQMD